MGPGLTKMRCKLQFFGSVTKSSHRASLTRHTTATYAQRCVSSPYLAVIYACLYPAVRAQTTGFLSSRHKDMPAAGSGMRKKSARLLHAIVDRNKIVCYVYIHEAGLRPQSVLLRTGAFLWPQRLGSFMHIGRTYRAAPRMTAASCLTRDGFLRFGQQDGQQDIGQFIERKEVISIRRTVAWVHADGAHEGRNHGGSL